MRVVIAEKGTIQSINLAFPTSVHSVFGDLSVTAQRETDVKGRQKVDVLFWDSSKKPDWKGRIFPVRRVRLDKDHSDKKVERGLFGLGGAVTLHLFR